MNRLIIAANRLPVQFREKNNEIQLQPSSGGLVSSMISYLEQVGSATGKALWVGTPDISEKKFKTLGDLAPSTEHFDLHPVFLPQALNTAFYQGFCNDCIWPLFHYFPSYARFSEEWFLAYQKVNRMFADEILRVYEPGDVIWIHDYHFMLLPALLRKSLPEATIGFFLHIPFPSFEVLRIMPNHWKREILDGLLGADLVGFHTNDYMQYFLRSVQRVTDYQISGRDILLPDRVVSADAFPVSIDFQKFFKAANSAPVIEEKNNIRKKMSGKQLLISVDRLDYSKAVINRLEAFSLFLQKNPSSHGKTTYMLLIVPSREIITRYKENKQEIERLVSNINGKYGNIDWTPVLYQYRSLDFHQLAGLYFSADAALITPVRDGMNLVAKEFVSTRVDRRGVLILSETAGAATELTEALIVNPTDRHEIAEAIRRALVMPVEEQMARNDVMQARIRNYNVVRWAEDFTGQLQAQKARQRMMTIKELDSETEKVIAEGFAAAQKKLILLDYDGTLVPFARMPHLATPSAEVMDLLTELCAAGDTSVAIVSGRGRDNLDTWFGTLPLTLVAEHGAFIRYPGLAWQETTPADLSWKPQVAALFAVYQARCAGSFIEEKSMSMAWHYRNADKEFGAIRARELMNELAVLAPQAGFELLDNNRVVEVRCQGINKGLAVKNLLSPDVDLLLAIGDDKTDEDLFGALPEWAYSIRVGLTQSRARYNFKKQLLVLPFLKRFLPTVANTVRQYRK